MDDYIVESLFRTLDDVCDVKAPVVESKDFVGDEWFGLLEGIWSMPDTDAKAEALISALSAPLTKEEAISELYDLLGDDRLFDELGELEDGADARAAVKEFIISEFLPKMEGELSSSVVSKLRSAVGLREALREDVFSLSTKEGAEKAAEFLEKQETEEPVTKVVDATVTDEEDLKKNYIGDFILQCPVCKTLMYKSPDLLKKTEGTDGVDAEYNEDDACPHCGSKGRFKLVGQVASVDAEDPEPKEHDPEMKPDGESEEKKSEEKTEVKSEEKPKEKPEGEGSKTDEKPEDDGKNDSKGLGESLKDDAKFLSDDEQEAIDGYDRVIANTDDPHVRKQLSHIKDEEEAHKRYLDKVGDDPSIDYEDPKGDGLHESSLQKDRVELPNGDVLSLGWDKGSGEGNGLFYVSCSYKNGGEDCWSTRFHREYASEADARKAFNRYKRKLMTEGFAQISADSIADFDETAFDALATSFAESVYDNVSGFSTKAVEFDGQSHRLVVEGVVAYASGAEAPAKFSFRLRESLSESFTLAGGCEELAGKANGSIRLRCSLREGMIKPEALRYDFVVGDSVARGSVALHSKEA